jgi:hypothetical protein
MVAGSGCAIKSLVSAWDGNGEAETLEEKRGSHLVEWRREAMVMSASGSSW